MTRVHRDAPAPARLRTRTHDAIAQLAELRSDDPAAEAAMRAVRLCRHTLECFWLPALDDLLETSHQPVDRT